MVSLEAEVNRLKVSLDESRLKTSKAQAELLASDYGSWKQSIASEIIELCRVSDDQELTQAYDIY